MNAIMTLQKNASKTRRFSRLMKLSLWLQKLPNKLTPPPFRLMQIGSAFWQSRVLYVATKLDIATQLGDEHLTLDELSARVSSQPEPTYRLLRMLTAMGIFEESSPRIFSNNKLSAPLRQGDPSSVRAMILMQNAEEMSRPWYEQLEQGVRGDKVPFSLTHGQDLFAYMDSHTEFDKLFSRAMDSVEALSGDSFATEFDWSRFDRVIDIGGSKGSKSLAILKRHSMIKALVVDRAQVIQGAKKHWIGHQDETVLTRINFQAGDLFGSLPTATSDKDIFLLSAVLHCFDDDTCVQALRNITRACQATGARIAIMELVMNKSKADLTSTLFDMQMFMGTKGRERTLDEWNDLFKRSELRLDEVVDLQSFGKIMVLQPNNR